MPPPSTSQGLQAQAPGNRGGGRAKLFGSLGGKKSKNRKHKMQLSLQDNRFHVRVNTHSLCIYELLNILRVGCSLRKAFKNRNRVGQCRDAEESTILSYSKRSICSSLLYNLPVSHLYTSIAFIRSSRKKSKYWNYKWWVTIDSNEKNKS